MKTPPKRLRRHRHGPGHPEAGEPGAALPKLRIAAVTLTLALIVLGFAWETVLAPLRPGGTLLAFKVLPLVLALPALARGSVRHYQRWSMAILAYLCEGVVRGMSDGGLSATLGWLEAVLAAAIYWTILRFAQLRRRLARAPASGVPVQ